MRRPRLLASAVLLGTLATGCRIGLPRGNLPGGAATRGEVYHVDVIFADVLDLVPQAAVKVDDVSVGSVESISLQGFQAKVRLRVAKRVELPANALAKLRQTSLLGEKFVELSPPEVGASGRLLDGAVIPVERTTRNPEFEEVFSALAALLNGGGLTELQTIAVELTRALGGREQQVRSVLRRINTLIGALAARKSEIVRAIDALDRLTATLARQRQTIVDALDEITPALTVLADQRAELTRLLQKLSELGRVGSRVVRASREDTLADLRLLEPILAQVVSVKTELAQTIDQLVTFTRLVPQDIPGDYLQLLVTLYVNPTDPAPVVGPPAAARPAPRVDAAPAGGVAGLLAGVIR